MESEKKKKRRWKEKKYAIPLPEAECAIKEGVQKTSLTADEEKKT